MHALDDGISRWRRVADAIRADIASGIIAQQLPPEVELAERHGVNRHTVRRAIAALSTEGLLRAERGRGTFVNAQPPRVIYPIGERVRFRENMMKQSIEPSGRLIGAERVAADARQAALLDVSVGAPLHRLERLAVVDGMPMSRSTSLFSVERFPDIISAYAETGSITQALQKSGVSDYRRRETRITAERVSPNDVDLLQCASDAIVLISNAVDVDMEGKPVQSVRTRFLADRFELSFKPDAD
ncbi:phosphonate metabolism transcriptional regulator PhnF [Rhizobium panacihumi]|uniref:phosphonate metabolism transcriptional regulator PhnF n=1 Tax=Rhizobium panacihumi TaxID=2008450 RepID=UPI003D794379